jgi:hypothetical protein
MIRLLVGVGIVVAAAAGVGLGGGAAEASVPSPVPSYRYQPVGPLPKAYAKTAENRALWALVGTQTRMQIEALIQSGKPTEMLLARDGTPIAARPAPGYRPWVYVSP